MKSILEAAPAELGAVKKRTIQSLAHGHISHQHCLFITKRIDEILDLVEHLKKEG